MNQSINQIDQSINPSMNENNENQQTGRNKITNPFDRSIQSISQSIQSIDHKFSIKVSMFGTSNFQFQTECDAASFIGHDEGSELASLLDSRPIDRVGVTAIRDRSNQVGCLQASEHFAESTDVETQVPARLHIGGIGAMINDTLMARFAQPDRELNGLICKRESLRFRVEELLPVLVQ